MSEKQSGVLIKQAAIDRNAVGEGANKPNPSSAVPLDQKHLDPTPQELACIPSRWFCSTGAAEDGNAPTEEVSGSN